jgi:hypothetical protein
MKGWSGTVVRQASIHEVEVAWDGDVPTGEGVVKNYLLSRICQGCC